MARAVCSRSSASQGLAVSERAVRIRVVPRVLTYAENDGYDVGFEASVQTGVVMPQR
ncbi:hypothetical protein GCM10010347_39100 [Streptomyces cirratus]|uniref:Uncharacterized protein n=1 Tax=Streptomyces cirratus TaxID=68187 RepID=A0ABQ3EV98_9ACTN|nr:hypothetical protein GCM10010347_39100 [Streptomyces cirratus]